MKKIFLQHNNIRKSLIEKYSGIPEQIIEGENEIYEYLKYLLLCFAKSYYVPHNILFKDLCENLKKWLVEEHKLKVEDYEKKDITVLNISYTSKLAKLFGLAKPVSLVISKNGTYLSFMFIDTKWFEKPVYDKKMQKGSFFTNFFVDNIEKYIFQYIIDNNPNSHLLNFAANENYYVEKFTAIYQQFFLAERQDDEILLAWLPVGSLKELALNKTIDKNISWFYVMTNFETLLLGFDKNGIITDAIDLHNRPMIVKKSMRTNVNIDGYQWTASLSYFVKYADLAKCATLNNYSRINEIAKFNVINSKNQKYYEFAKFLLTHTNNLISPLTIFLLDYITDSKKATEEYSKNDKLNKIIIKILNSPEAEENLVFWHNDWKLNIEQSVFIIKILIETAENQQHLKIIFPLHTKIYKNFLSKEKDKYNKILYDIEYSRHLIALEKYSEAEKILKNDLKKMPDETVVDLLPPENIDPTGELGGKFLKVMILELLSNVQSAKETKNYVREIAVLQPLAINRIYDLTSTADKSLKEKANLMLNILKGNGLSANTEKLNIKYITALNKDLEELKHESVQKNGVLYSFTKWLSSYKTPDVSAVKKFADRMSPAKHPVIADIIADLIHFFNFENLEVYISHGDYSVGIRSFDALPPFITIGSEHLAENSPYYLTYNELKFAISSELTFLYFKFSKITSSDIWRGAMDKGTFVLDTFISLIPFAGNMRTLLKNAKKITLISNFIEKNEKISKALNKGQKLAEATEKSSGILHIASQMMEAIKNVKPKNENAKKEELIAVSRMMQITADRVALVVTNDIVSAVRSTFLTSGNLVENLTYANKYGLNSFILKKNERGQFYNLNLAVRFAALFSFWISEKFETIHNKIIEK